MKTFAALLLLATLPQAALANELVGLVRGSEASYTVRYANGLATVEKTGAMREDWSNRVFLINQEAERLSKCIQISGCGRLSLSGMRDATPADPAPVAGDYVMRRLSESAYVIHDGGAPASGRYVIVGDGHIRTVEGMPPNTLDVRSNLVYSAHCAAGASQCEVVETNPAGTSRRSLGMVPYRIEDIAAVNGRLVALARTGTGIGGFVGKVFGRQRSVDDWFVLDIGLDGTVRSMQVLKQLPNATAAWSNKWAGGW